MEWNTSFTGGRLTPKSLNLSSVSGRTPISARRRSVLQSNKKTSSRYPGNARASQKIITVTPHHIVESHGVSLPVLVTEALTYADRSTVGSVRISPSGWAWLVTGRRLFVWQYRQPQAQSANRMESGGRRWAVTGQCRELNLPPSDLSHKADLVCIIAGEGNHVPSCVAVTPEGTVRYWPSITHEGASVEDNADLQGQECDSLTYLGPHGCLLATTTSTIVMVVPQVIEGRHSIYCRTLKTPQGWLGGISRRVSSLIFGSITASQAMEARISRVIAVPPGAADISSGDGWKVYLLTGHSLQQWLIGESEQLIAEYDLDRISREAFQQFVWGGEAGIAGDSKVWLLDMQLVEGGFMVLAAAVNPACSQMMHYAFGTIYNENTSSPVKFASFIPIKHTSYYLEEEELKSWNFHFLLHGSNAIMFNYKSIVCVSVASSGEDPDNIDFMTSDDRVLGGALCGSIPLFFMKNHGLISILPYDGPADTMNSSVMGDSNISDQSQIQQFAEGISISFADIEEISTNKDTSSKLTTAFLHYLQKDQAQCDAILQDLFPASVMGKITGAGEARKVEVNGPIDQLVVTVSQDIINDIPSGDPRWTDLKQTTASIKSTGSLQILNQLQGKQKVLAMFLEFLRTVNLWEKLSAFTVHGIVQSTAYVLAEHEEKLVAAISLKTLHTEHTILDPVIKRVQSERTSNIPPNLTYVDLFFQEVSRVHEAIKFMCKYSDEIAESNRPPNEIATTLTEINTVILAVLQEVVQFRQQNARSFSANIPGMEYLPWTAASGKAGLRDSLELQHSVTLKNGARLAGEASLKNQLYDQVVNLVDIILDGCKCHLESVQATDKYPALLQQYEAERMNYIKPLFDDKEYERAAVLAEKYCDFEILVLICDATGNDERLRDYQEKFSDQGFSNFLYSWYLREQKQGELLEKFKHSARSIMTGGATLSGLGRPSEGARKTLMKTPRGGMERSLRTKSQRDALGSFLSNHPSISWMLDVFDGEHARASSTLCNLASRECDSLNKKKSMLSLAKLALFASIDEMESAKENALEWVNNQLTLITYQEDLPESTVISYGYEPDNMPVLIPAEIIKLYIADECQEATEFEFSKALDVLSYVEDEAEKVELWLSIWCKAILRDEWVVLDSVIPVNICKRKLFFKLVEFALMLGKTPHEVLPPIDKIMEMEELGSLRESSGFQYLLKIGYEHYLKL